ncbi:DUF502 domain-containing protein [Alkaliphilus metalliredigens]|uniref:DUF502 domain-containing protein n=1 Tax=Alkaliphilus metalliredigens TaxID=208226 RepID=UPI0009FDFCAF
MFMPSVSFFKNTSIFDLASEYSISTKRVASTSYFISPRTLSFSGYFAICFITSDATDEINQKSGKSMKSVFIPTTPNPTPGMLVMLPNE